MTPTLAPRLSQGNSPLLVSVPHAGTGVPDDILQRFTGEARALPDTDWYVDRLYAFAESLGVGMLVACASRYVVDLNRPPDDHALYTSAETRLTTGLIPLTTFCGEPLYLAGQEPKDVEIAHRVQAWWRPYHEALQGELSRLVAEHGHAVLLDAHSIRSHLPLLFPGELPVFNLGSNGGQSAAPALIDEVYSCLSDGPYSHVLDGRFRGGHITRHYGRPQEGVHVLQLEMAQSAYMDEDRFAWTDAMAAPVQTVLRSMVRIMSEWRPGGS